ncbi:hypothetical protein B0G76_8603 [Paraburkholderia sp. BL23I1N1]|uniref:hypothetical protein n=1 Tax=Paraburkholderia sp. BL23I1N1 TaxID=1938802 RepID=UPI000E719F1E|nr:hypothetical protein [Paraburkholderia sp. BL23I1N1]RKE23903.1 hypothetical protein B0G76_8603 [Paraburkholderia sp. BL23I1N1]
MHHMNSKTVTRRVPARAIAARTILGLVVYAGLIALLTATARQILAPFKPELHRILSALPTEDWALACICIVLLFLALQIPGIGAAIAAGAWELAGEVRRAVRRTKGRQS